MNFSDLPLRLITASMLWIVLALWLWMSERYTFVWEMGVILLASICLYEWFRMGQGKSIPLRIIGAAIIGLGFWICISSFSILFVLLLGPISDTAAYFGGRLMGGPKLCPTISPSKTWAGFLSGILFAPILYLLYCRYLFSFENLRFFNQITVVVMGMGLLSLGAQMGDLLESWAKRVFGVKDSGSWLPGQGGLLDRMDSILGVAIMGFLMASLARLILWCMGLS